MKAVIIIKIIKIVVIKKLLLVFWKQGNKSKSKKNSLCNWDNLKLIFKIHIKNLEVGRQLLILHLDHI